MRLMKTYLDCFPCFLKQAIECARLSCGDTALHRKSADRIMNILLSLDSSLSPPDIAREVYAEIKKITGNNDPYRMIKQKDNRQMLDVYSEMERMLSGNDSLYPACKLAAGGNIIDSGAGKRKEDHGSREIEDILASEPVINEFPELRDQLSRSKKLLYIGDNAGEIVADKLFIQKIQKEFPDLSVTFAVRGFPIINDATVEDALEVGMDKICAVIANGDAAPGTVLKKCSQEFREHFERADIIIAKGQGNYETLSGGADKILFFLLIAKFPVIARHLNVSAGSMIIKKCR